MRNSHRLQNYLENGSVSIHKDIIHILATEMYKISQDLSSSIMYHVFSFQNEIIDNLRQVSQFF